jgi:hypothetical protein
MKTLAIESFAGIQKLRDTTIGFLAGIDEHKKFISSCKPDLQNVFWPYVTERQDLAARWQHPNLIIPFLINELFNVKDVRKLQTLCAAYLACDHFTHLLDDLADEKQRDDKALLAHASHLMLSRGRRLYVSIASEPSGFLDFFEKYLERAMYGEQALWKRLKNTKPYDDGDFEMLRARGSILNICLIAYCDITERWHLWNRLEHAFGEIIVGVQLLDDVADVDKDFQNGIYTKPLATSITELKKHDATWNNLAERLIFGAGWTDTISLAVSYLQRGEAELAELGLSSICTALNHIIASSQELTQSIKRSQAESDLSAVEKVSLILKLPIVRNLSH